jgi:hypothetical protein
MTVSRATIETAKQFSDRLFESKTKAEDCLLIEMRDAAVARAAKLQALCDMHNTAQRLRKYGREPKWLGAAFAELRSKYQVNK